MSRSIRVLLACAFLGCAAPAPQPLPPAPPSTGSAMPSASIAVHSAGSSLRTIRRSHIVHSRRSGSSTTTVHPDGRRESTLEIVENGRGPKVQSRVQLAPDGTLLSFDATGQDTMGLPVDEHFSSDGHHARWKSTNEAGEKDVAGPAFYLPLAQEADSLSLLAEALFARKAPLALLPEGEARLTRVGETTVKSATGETRHLVAGAITGLWFTPTYVWIDDAGQAFGSGGSWISVVPEGWEPAADTLIEEEKKLEQKRMETLALQLAQRAPAAGLALRGARVLDVAARRYSLDQTLLIEGSTIKAVGPSKAIRIPEGAEILEVRGKTVLPGLWDMHAHLGPGDGEMYLASGITTVRDMGNDPDRLDDLKKRFDEGRALGPRVLRAGFVEGRGDKAAGSKVTAETEAEAQAGVEFFARRGYEQLKIYNSIKPELVPVLAKAAQARGMRVSGHVPVHLRAEEAVRAGFDELNHINMVFLNFFIDKNTDTRTTLRFTIPAERAAGLDLKSQPVRDFLQLLVQRKTVIDPTVHVFEELFLARPGTISPNYAAIAHRLPASVRRGFTVGGLPVPEGKDQLYRDSFAALLKMIKLLQDSKIPLVAGTDSFGLVLVRELELYAQAGIPPGAVLEIATLGAARVMKKDRTSGSLAVGKDADLIVVDGDPLNNISDLRNVTAVVRGGIRFEPARLYESIGVKP